ncbi:MAG: amidase [Acidobacteriota bacterium]|nr:amidase [Acidobacteriota bacterium]
MESLDRRKFLEITALAGAGIVMSKGIEASNAPNAKTFELEEITVSQLQTAMQKGELSAKDIAKKYLERIEDVDKKTINSIIEINPDALEIAEQLDRERKSGKIRGRLHGVPIVLKDNIDTADKMKTTAGSLALLDAPTPMRDAFLVEQLRRAGAVVLAKTNLSEWANFRSSNSTSGWSGRGGQTRNPYILDRNPCGSSSGTGAGIAANMAAIGIGTETDGSIVCPASMCGIVGLKPTVGLISRSGIIPISHTQDTAGPMTRSVADAAILLSVLTGVDGRDSATAQNNKKARKDYESFLRKDGLKNARIGVARDFWGKRAEVDAVMNDALDAMKQSGAILVDVKIPTLNKFGDAEYEVLLYEFKADLEKYLVERNSPYKTLADLIKFNEENAAREMPYFKQEIFESSAKKGSLTSRPYLQALTKARTLSRAQGIDAVMTKNNVEALIAPTNAPTWMIDLVNGDCGSNYVSSSSLAAVSGYPSITVPAGFVRELPIGISFFGRAYTEHILIKLAYAFEQLTNARRVPKFLPTYQ